MKIEGQIIKGTRILDLKVVEIVPPAGALLSKVLDVCMQELCKELAVPWPIWLSKNTREWKMFHQTFFFQDQFAEAVRFDHLMIKEL